MTTLPPPLPPVPTPERLRDARVLVVGDVMLDRYWFGAVERISPEAPVPVVRVEREEDRLGGAANVARNITALGARCTLMSVVGEDEAAGALRRLLGQQDIDHELGHDPQLRTVVKLRVIGRAQQLMRVDFENAPDHEVLAQMSARFEQILDGHDVVVFSDYGKGGLAHIPHMIRTARAAGLQVLVDPKGADYRRYAGATLITPNRAELAQVVGAWTGEDDLRHKAARLRDDLAVEHILLTRSEEGMTLFSREDVQHLPTRAREVFDVTGAGDTVIATLAAMLAGGLDLPAAMGWANAAAGVVVGKFGTASVSREELVAC